MDDNPGVNSLTAGLDELASYLEGSTLVVQAYTDIIERKYARPALDKISRYFQGQPLTMTWVTITLTLFAGLSILPVLSFIGLSIFALCSSMSIALAFAFAAVVALETMFATVLLLVLGGLLFFSFVVTTFGAMAYLTFRLVQHLQIHGRFGIAEWAQKTKQHFTSVSVKPEGSDDLDESGVLIAHEANDTVKRENLSPSPSRSLVESSGSL
ncbi:uncharacterized protein F5891DRAFT_1017193 [Suillus fuscotomentosus]|uniref:Promethin n=1 Tax=Suillus fuscotomentosus TaxID=1912939 RepID=A0AAD4HNY0_9AGAM|nr:uncharacterized protein F5891DRAFT_1017193 [Suillus fuscotomentosus]KAG1903598.1 hypothetical protein F5891DRAFT_1017193 [Suillus fuscotomentosus]